jgi:hypothetical protein
MGEVAVMVSQADDGLPARYDHIHLVTQLI